MRAAVPPVQEERRLFSSPELAVTDYRCRAKCHPPGPEEHVDAHSIVFVRAGAFRYTMDGETIAADPNYVLFFPARRPYRVAHPVAGGVDCTTLSLSTRLLREAVAAHAPRVAETNEPAFPARRAPSTIRALRLQYELLAALRALSLPALAVEDLIAALTDEVVREACAAAGRPATGGGDPRRARELVEAARTRLQARVGDPPGLMALSRQLGCSPFHLSRTFRRVTGVPLRRYHARLRARAAAERLLQRARDLTALALDLGYADHSHFTNAFRREWGESPSRFREAVAACRAGR